MIDIHLLVVGDNYDMGREPPEHCGTLIKTHNFAVFKRSGSKLV